MQRTHRPRLTLGDPVWPSQVSSNRDNLQRTLCVALAIVVSVQCDAQHLGLSATKKCHSSDRRGKRIKRSSPSDRALSEISKTVLYRKSRTNSRLDVNVTCLFPFDRALLRFLNFKRNKNIFRSSHTVRGAFSRNRSRITSPDFREGGRPLSLSFSLPLTVKKHFVFVFKSILSR